MTIERHKGLDEAHRLVEYELRRRCVRWNTQAGGDTNAELSAPLPVYQLGMNAAAGENPLAKAVHSGWGYLSPDGGTQRLIQVQSQANGLVFAGISEGFLPEQILRAAEFAHEKLGSSQERLEPRLLFLHALKTAVLWLHGERNYFVPFLEGVPRTDHNLRVVDDPNSFLKELANSAKNRMPPGLP